jgi:chromate transporter
MIEASRDGGTANEFQNAPAPFGEAVRVWAKIGLLSFGGPAGQIALMHRILVDEKRWIDEDRFLHALNYCMLLPGPEAQQLAIYIGWLMHRIKGGVVAGVLFVLPGAGVILLLSIVYALFEDIALTEAIFFGIKAAVLAVVAQAVLKIGKRALKTRLMYAIAGASFTGIFFFDVPFPMIVISAGILGFTVHYLQRRPTDGQRLDAAGHARPSVGRNLRVAGTCLALWWLPVAALAIWLGVGHVFVQEGVFFSKTAVVTFGGAYAVLAYIAQQAVDTYGWLEPGEMLDGLGLAETTPGPLIMVVQFVGFLGAYRNPGMLDPLLAGVIGAAITTWVTFVPCFLWIFLGAPYIESLRNNRALGAALSAITAAVVGVIINLAAWFALHVIFAVVDVGRVLGARWFVPQLATLDPAALALTAAAVIAMLRFNAGMLPTLGVCALAGIVIRLLFGW